MLLFALQPMAAKRLLPLYGGTSSVWTICLLFFQAGLLLGYFWAHQIRRTPRWHLALLGVAAGFAILPMTSPLGPAGSSTPVFSLLWDLGRIVGLPYVALSATSPLVQSWTGDYRLYAYSNAGSIAGLFGYVFLLDRLNHQDLDFRIVFCGFAVLMGWCLYRAGHPRIESAADTESRPPLKLVLLWIALAACGSGLLAATTNQICQEVAPVPLLWVWPLALYLLSFILCFENDRWYRPIWFGRAAAVLIPAACVVTPMGTDAPFWAHLLIDSAALFVCLMLCHGELVAARPEESSLTSFYLAVAAGGALGALFVAVAAPQLFTSYVEFPVFLMLAGLFAVVQWWVQTHALPPILPLALGALSPLALISADTGPIAAEMRNFFGVVRVTMGTDARGAKLVMTHGKTMHGSEYIAEKLHPRPSTYYTEQSGVGLAIERHRHGGALQVGVAGLGTGTLAAYAHPGDQWSFYEINPDVVRLANEPFTYLRTGRIRVVLGDARQKLGSKDEAGIRFDVLVVDAFSSDSIPVHLLTRECGEVYRTRLKDDGLLAIHISNRTLNLEPVVRGLAQSLHFSVLRINNANDTSRGVSAASWMILAARDEPLEDVRPYAVAGNTGTRREKSIIWSDGHASILSVLDYSVLSHIR
jgi:hypothetical protein